MPTDDTEIRQEALPLEGLPPVSPLEHAAQSDNPWARLAYRTYILVRDAHEGPRVDRQTRLARLAAAYDAWVETNSASGTFFDPDNPTPEQESELHQMQLEADPTTVSVEWALENVTRTRHELAELLRSGMYGSLSEAEISEFLARPQESWRLEGTNEDESTT